MAKLYFSLDGTALGEFTLNKDRITIGRRPTNNIHIDNLAVSGEHAVITTIAGESFLEDLNSTNGTIVNQKPIKKHVLNHADVIEFGKYQLRFENLAQQKLGSQHAFENTAVMPPSRLNIPSIKPKEADTKEADTKEADKTLNQKVSEAIPSDEQIPDGKVIPQTLAMPQPSVIADNQAPKRACLHVVTGANSGTELMLNKSLTTLGDSSAQVAVITKRPHGYFLSHVQGDKLPFINGQRLGLQAHQLLDGDMIDVAGTKMKFNLV